MAGKWTIWTCTHQLTQFFRIARKEVEPLVPPALVPHLLVDKDGFGSFEVGFSHFPSGTQALPATNELSVAIQLKAEARLRFGVFALNIAADNQEYLDHTLRLDRYRVHLPPVRFSLDLDRREIVVHDHLDNPIVLLRHHTKGSIPLPFLPLVTETWSQLPQEALQRRLFKWRGPALLHRSPFVASSLLPHPFFRGLDVSRADPMSIEVFASHPYAAGCAQLLTSPENRTPK